MRYYNTPNDLRFTESEDNKVGFVRGYASVFDVVDSYDTTFARGCFQKSLEKRMPKFLLHHDSTKPAGVTRACKEDERGLYFEGEINLQSDSAREAYSFVKQKAMEGFSIGFVPKVWEDNDERDIRTFKEVDLMEVSLVVFPANESALITSVRSELPKDIREFERFLRDAGYSRTDAKRIAGHGFKSLNQEQCEAEDDLKRQMQDFINLIKGKTNE
jgi:HK97 family phage prohead protease